MRFWAALVAAVFIAGCKDRSSSGSDVLLIGGTIAEAGQFPSTVLLAMPGGRCGAGKVGPRRFITAAHCVAGGIKKGSSLAMLVGIKLGAFQKLVATVTDVHLSPFFT